MQRSWHDGAGRAVDPTRAVRQVSTGLDRRFLRARRAPGVAAAEGPFIRDVRPCRPGRGTRDPRAVSGSRTTPSTDGRTLLRTWVWSVTVAECLGFSAPATAGAVSADWPALAAVGLLVPAGAVEGAMLGWAQARLLRRVLVPFAAGRFVVATSVAAAFAYAVAMVPVVLGDRLLRVPVPLLLLLGALLGAMLLTSIGVAQWMVLRASVPRSASWIATTAGAWVVGLLAFTAVTTPLWQPGQQVPLVVAIGLLGGVVMAAAVASVTGLGMLRLLSRARVSRDVRD